MFQCVVESFGGDAAVSPAFSQKPAHILFLRLLLKQFHASLDLEEFNFINLMRPKKTLREDGRVLCPLVYRMMFFLFTLDTMLLFQILGYADHVFTGLFTIEIILKVVFNVYDVICIQYKFTVH